MYTQHRVVEFIRSQLTGKYTFTPNDVLVSVGVADHVWERSRLPLIERMPPRAKTNDEVRCDMRVLLLNASIQDPDVLLQKTCELVNREQPSRRQETLARAGASLAASHSALRMRARFMPEIGHVREVLR